MNELSPKVFEAAVEATESLLKFSHPADKSLSYFFRTHRELGSKERPLVADLAYSVIRNKTYLEKTSNSQDPESLCLIALNKIFGISWKHLRSKLGNQHNSEIDNISAVSASPLSPSERFSLPEWIWEKLVSQYGEERTSELARSMLSKASFDLRVNELKRPRSEILSVLAAEGLEVSPTPISKTGIRLSSNVGLQKHPLFLDGSIEVQDEGSQILVDLVGAKRGQMVVDFCAGAGGKTLALGSDMRSTGRLYAFDISAKRLERFKPRLKRSGLSNVHPQLIGSAKDPRLQRLHGKIDRVLIDAPCTGLGTLRRNPDIKWRQKKEDLAALCDTQLSILGEASKLAKTGGRIVYATCSLLREENEQIIEKFLSAHHGRYQLIDVSTILSHDQLTLSNLPYLTLSPDIHDCDGFFAAVIEAI
ncbi:MAG: RsmB/NOP family class I SAM-dependent RNA methyltransferase [Betaproteobacteria bacterium]